MVPRVHGLAEVLFRSQVLPCHPHKVSCALPNFLCGSEHVVPLVQQLLILFHGEVILYYCQQDLDPHCVLIHVLCSDQLWGGGVSHRPPSRSPRRGSEPRRQWSAVVQCGDREVSFISLRIKMNSGPGWGETTNFRVVGTRSFAVRCQNSVFGIKSPSRF